MKQKYKEIITEVIDEVNSALSDSKGIVSHQRRLAFSLSLGVSTLIEMFLDKKQILKSGAKINHLWLKKKKENAKEIISRQIISPIDSVEEIDELLNLAYKIENKRDNLAYGKTVSENELKKITNIFLDLKNEVEND
ncbi:MAG: hypothetical protein PVJ67_00715 [Candidatus Pacearchaeota archaeon]|jgi:hypothetical protein